MQILTEPNRDVRTEIADRMAFLTRIPRRTVIEEIERSAKTFLGYSMAASMINTKPTFLLERWIAEGEARL
jgi:F420-non-reducing hydrogenase small subunit